jgi:competence protein ComEA
VLGLLAAGIILLTAGQPDGEPVELSSPPTPAGLVVHVIGSVNAPGVYELVNGSRLSDAIQAAGGLSTNANDQELNLAEKVMDGQQIRVPAYPTPTATRETTATTGEYSTVTSRLIDINIDDQEALESLPGIGPVLAQRIIKYRTVYGPFQSVEDILVIYGLSEDVYNQIKDMITVGESP